MVGTARKKKATTKTAAKTPAKKANRKARPSLAGPNVFRLGTPGGLGVLAARLSKRSKGLAAVVRAGGLLADHGWIRLFAGGSELPSIDAWNYVGSVELGGEPSYYVAADVIGGFFLLASTGAVYYVRPDTRALEEAGKDYDAFLAFVLRGDLESFYRKYRFAGWRAATEALSPDEGFISKPPLWARGGLAAFRKKRRVVPALPDLRNAVIEAFEARSRAQR
jgi:hypothetical protein